MTRFVVAALAAVLLSGTSAMAADLVVDEPVAEVAVPNGFYATFFAGGSWASGDTTIDIAPGVGFVIETDLDAGFIIGGAIGTTLQPNLRGEVEFSYIQADVDSIFGSPVPDDVSLTSTGFNLLGNLWYDFSNDSGFTPYVGAGVGYGTVEVSGDLPGEVTASGLLYQLGAGVKVDVADNIALDLGYRYRVLSDADTTTDIGAPPPGVDITTDAVNHIVQAGVTFGF
ncbi:MAG: porin family protein [Devosia sp.]|nr:porin family protein [Devosia sp.]